MFATHFLIRFATRLNCYHNIPNTPKEDPHVLKLKTLYIRNIAEELLAKRKPVTIFILLCAALFAVLGVRQGSVAHTLSEEQQQEIAEYQDKIKEYDEALADIAAGQKEVEKQVAELQEYVDNSIYMQIDPQNVQVVSTQYGLQTGGNVGNIYNSFITFINDGGMKESLPEESRDLKVEYWRDIINPYQSGNVFTITVIHHDAAQAQEIMDIVKQRIQDHVPQVKNVQGDFNLIDMGTSTYVKSDVNIVNGQNGHRNNLKNYVNNRADFHSKLISTQTNKENFIEKNEPETLEASAPGKLTTIIKYVILGIIFGIALPCAAIALRYILSDRLRSGKDLKDSSLNVLGTYGEQKKHQPELERTLMDIQALAGEAQVPSVYLNALSDDDISKNVSDTYAKALTEAGLPAEAGTGAGEHAAELKKMIAGKSCILVAQAGKTTSQQLEQQLELCARFKVAVLGCVVIE